jgi:DNA-directed RNA polymerase specialized sigma24 family protein
VVVNETPRRPWTEPGRDPELALSAQRGDLGALFTLLRKYRRELWRVCFALTLDRSRAERLFHDTLLRAAKNLGSLPAGTALLPWLARLAAHLATASTRKDASGAPVKPSLSPAALGTTLGDMEQPVLEAFAHLAEADRLLLALAAVEKLTYPELAAVARREVPGVMGQLSVLRTRLAGEESA